VLVIMWLHWSKVCLFYLKTCVRVMLSLFSHFGVHVDADESRSSSDKSSESDAEETDSESTGE